MNTELLLKVKDAIVSHPEKYDQETFCGTECCIAGWALIIAEPDIAKQLASQVWDFPGRWESLWLAARKNMGLTDAQMGTLCSMAEDWPADFSDRYYDADSAEARARIGAERIDHFIATGGAE